MLLDKLGPISDHIEVLATSQLPIFLVKGKDWALIEGAMSFVAPTLFEQLDKMDGAKERLKYLFISHSHFDHVGAVPAIKRTYPDIQVIASESAKEVFSKPNALAYIKGLNDAIAKASAPKSGVDLSIKDGIPVDRTA